MWWNTQPPWTQTAVRGAPRCRPPLGPRVAVRGPRDQRTCRDGRTARSGAPNRARVGARAVELRRRGLLARLRPAGLLRLAAGFVTSRSCGGGGLRRRGGSPPRVRGPRVAVRGPRDQRTCRDGRTARSGAPNRARVGARAVELRRRGLLARLRPAGLLRLAAGFVTSRSCGGGVLRRRGGRPRAVRG